MVARVLSPACRFYVAQDMVARTWRRGYLLCTRCLYLPMCTCMLQGGSFTVAPIDGETLERRGKEEVRVLGRGAITKAFKVGPV